MIKLHNNLQMMKYIFLMNILVNLTFSRDKMGILMADLNNINLDEVNFYEDDPETIIHGRRMALHNRYNNVKYLKRIKHRLNACRIASNKMLGLGLARRREKGDRNNICL